MYMTGELTAVWVIGGGDHIPPCFHTKLLLLLESGKRGVLIVCVCVAALSLVVHVIN